MSLWEGLVIEFRKDVKPKSPLHFWSSSHVQDKDLISDLVLKKNPKTYGLGLSSRHAVSSHSLDVDVALERSTRQRQDPQKYCNTLKAGNPPFRSSLGKDHRVCLDSNMLLLLDRRGRRISACRLIGCFSPRCKHSRQHERSLGKAGASPTWLHCAACRLLSHRSALALRLTPPPSTSIAYHHSCHL